MINESPHRHSNSLAVSIFCKAITAFVLLRMLVNWGVSAEVAEAGLIGLPTNLIPRILFYPSAWAVHHHTAFYVVSISILLLTLIAAWNYLLAGFVFLLVLNLYRLNVPIANGSDLVTTWLTFWTIGMAMTPRFKNRIGNLQELIYSLFIILCQIQVVGIYLISGWDKILNEAWRSGDAFVYISRYEPLFNPSLKGVFESETIQWLSSWLTIVFEIAFVVLVWFRKTRNFILLTGVVFHVAIIVMLSLPEFGILMILSYLIFLKDEDYDRIKSWVKQLRQ